MRAGNRAAGQCRAARRRGEIDFYGGGCLRARHVKVEDDAAQRAVNAKDYLVTEQGIDASRITTATGTADDQSVQNYLVPAGATFTNDVQGTTPVDETAVKPQQRKPLK